MHIREVLEQKQKAIQMCGNPLLVSFTVDDIDVLSDVNELRSLKLCVQFPKDYESSKGDIFLCTKHILEGDSVYRVLEFCILKNRVLKSAVISVFPKIGEVYEK